MNLRCKYSPLFRVAVTGATGYLGLKLLEVFDASDFLDTDFSCVPAGAVIIHLAANMQNSREALAENMLIDTHVLEQVNEKHRGLIFASTNNVYPFALNCKTSDNLRCNDYYSAAKIFAEKLFDDCIKTPFVSIRIADVFGVGQKHGNFFRAIEQSIRTNNSLSLFGAGSKRRSYIHATELVLFLKWIAVEGFDLATAKRALNVGYSDSASILEIVTKVAEHSKLDVTFKSIENDRSHFDIRTMQTSFLSGYTPKWSSFQEALTDYVEEINL
ncbi:NAD-dependent epimerase/dehydratase family protein [Pseudomonas sp. NPDC087598]|uniref:NAD-dependent epimerase/dehydratase family protein n=1 Tax=Pseudomonas sp. NPDC087598 TaxID=3364440 RepID=UPI00382853B2